MDTNSPERTRWNDSAATTRNREESSSFRKDLHGRNEAVAVSFLFSTLCRAGQKDGRQVAQPRVHSSLQLSPLRICGGEDSAVEEERSGGYAMMMIRASQRNAVWRRRRGRSVRRQQINCYVRSSVH